MNALAHLEPAVTGAVAFYDSMRTENTEAAARHLAELYLRRKCARGIDANGAAIVLADALARRASERIRQVEESICQRQLCK